MLLFIARRACARTLSPALEPSALLQATVMGLLSAVMFFVLSNAKPLEKLSPQRPVPNIFCPYVFLSLMGQFAVHLVYLVIVWNMALASMAPVRVLSPAKDHRVFEWQHCSNIIIH